uniref:Transposase n=1 Tax=Globodera pallida TaxID=36090 RepID=A0A183CKJ0_GLOPA
MYGEVHDECKIMDIEQHLSKCNEHETKAYIQVQDLCSRKTKYFEIMLTDLIKRQLPIVIGFDIAASDGQVVFEIEYKNEFCYQTFPSISKNVLIGADAFNINSTNKYLNVAS